MDVETIPPSPTGDAPSEPSSLMDRLVNVIAAPGQAFAELKNAPVRASNWLVPLILACIATAVYVTIAFSQPAIVRNMQEQREATYRKLVATGKMTQAQADQAAAAFDQIMTPAITKILYSAVAVLASAAGLFLLGLAIWLALKFCTEARLDYMKVIEICGLALVIDIPQKILRGFLVLWKDNLLATASPTLFLDNPSTTNKTHVFLSMIDLGDLWWLAVLSLGLSKVASIRYRTAAIVTCAIWFGFRLALTLLTPSPS